MEFMLCTLFFIVLISLIASTGIKLSARSINASSKLDVVAKTQRCAMLADSLAANPETRSKSKIACPIFEGCAAGDFNGKYICAKMFANAGIVGKKNGFEVVVYGSHYR